MDIFRCERRTSRSLRASEANWSVGLLSGGGSLESVSEALVDEIGALSSLGLVVDGVGGGFSPATNMTGESCMSSSGGYEFIPASISGVLDVAPLIYATIAIILSRRRCLVSLSTMIDAL